MNTSFIKSETKKGMLMTISEEQLNKNLKQKIFKLTDEHK